MGATLDEDRRGPFSYLHKGAVLQKPHTCQGCPAYGDGKGYVPDLIQPHAKVTLLEFQPSQDDMLGRQVIGWNGPRDPIVSYGTPQPLCGSTGAMLTKTFFPLAKLQPHEVNVAYVIRCRAQLTKETYEDTIACCTHAHPHSTPRGVVLAHGEEAWHATQGPTYPLHEWRGFLGPTPYHGAQVYGVQHMRDLVRDPHAKFIARFDWKRFARLLQQEWPLPVPHRVVASPAHHGEFMAMLQEALCQPEIMVDTEYIPDEQLLTHVGAAWRVGETVHGFQLEWLRGQATSMERAVFMRYWPKLCGNVKMGFWNAKADLPILEHNLHTIPDRIEDPMQAHAVLWPDMDHDYGFVASLYGKYNKLKHLAKTDILLYHWGDMIDLVWIWEALKDEFTQDPHAEAKYRQQNLPLLPILLATEARGLRLDQRRIEAALPHYLEHTRFANQLASAYAGCPFNLGSTKQVLTHLAYDGIVTKSINKDTVAQLRATCLPFDADHEAQHGFSRQYIEARCAQGAHPLLELRTMYAQAKQVLSHYLEPLRGKERCYPQINIHTQAGGRHSTTNPPLATLPSDLRDILVPDPGQVWIGWDWDQQEPRIQRGESQSRVLGAAFDAGVDIHTTFVCDLYGWTYPSNLTNPHTAPEDGAWRQAHNWQGKDDPRRVFAKTTRYECVPLDTQILTRTGWKTHDQIERNEEVLVYDESIKQKQWGRLLDIVYNQEEVVELSHRHFKIRATASHRWYVNQRSWQGRSWKRPYMEYGIKQTQELTTESNIITNAPLWDDEGMAANLDQVKYGTDWVNEVCKMSFQEREAFILGFALADGHCHKKNGTWMIDQKDGPLWDAILTACFIQKSGAIHACAPDSRSGVKRLRISKKSHVTMQQMRKRSLGVQDVWCPVTSHGSWVMRQGDQISITGNCNYGGKGDQAAKKAIRMGIEPHIAKRGATVLLQGDPELSAWFRKVEKEVASTHMIHSWDGGRRVFYWIDASSKQQVEEMKRQARNFPPQGGGAGLYNLVIVEIAQAVPEAQFVYGMHDSQYWSVSKGVWNRVYPRIKEIATQSRLINGMMVPFPGSFKVIYEDGRTEKVK